METVDKVLIDDGTDPDEVDGAAGDAVEPADGWDDGVGNCVTDRVAG